MATEEINLIYVNVMALCKPMLRKLQSLLKMLDGEKVRSFNP